MTTRFGIESLLLEDSNGKHMRNICYPIEYGMLKGMKCPFTIPSCERRMTSYRCESHTAHIGII